MPRPFLSRHRRLHQLCYAICAAAIVALTGCGRSPYDLAPVHGLVTMDDLPLTGCTVRFAPIAKDGEVYVGKPAAGRIQEDGKYRLTTLESNDGAVVGEHWVTIMNVKEELPKGVPEFGRVSVPEKKVVVAGQDNEINIRLTKEIIRKYREDDT